MPTSKKLSQQPVAPALLPGDRLPVLRRAVDEADVEKRNPTAGAQAVAEWVGQAMSPNSSRSLLKEFRFFREADHDADPDGGACFETDLDWDKCCGNTVCIIDFYRESDAEPFRNERLVCVYDPAPTDPTHQAWIDGSFTGTRNPSKFVPEGSVEAQLANIPVLDPAKTNYPANTVVQYTIGGQVFLYQAVAAGGPFAAPTAADGSGTANWKAIGKPTPAGNSYTKDEADQRFSTLLYENLSAYGSGDYDLPAEKVGRAINVAILEAKRLNLPVLTLESVPATLLLSSDENNNFPLEIWGARARDENKNGVPTLITTLQPGDRLTLLAAKTQRFYPNTGFAPGYVVDSITRVGGGVASDSFDPYDVPTAKALQVIADYQAAGGPFVETDTAGYGRIIIDDYTEPGDEFKYECSPSRPATTGGATVWKWRRYLEAGV